MSRFLGVLLLLLVLVGGQTVRAQFVDTFESSSLEGWTHQTGDGRATMDLHARDGQALVTVDATEDHHNIWWAVIQRDVSDPLDLDRLREPDRELRVTARIRVSHAPRRVNLSLHTQRTTDFHSHLMEFDLPDTTGWHTISMTTDDFDARPGDTVRAQMALMDWGRETYRAAVDSFAVAVVDTAEAEPDAGTAVPYPLPVQDPDSLAHRIPAVQVGMIHRQFPDVRLRNWHAGTGEERSPAHTVTTNQFVLLRWKSAALPAGPVSGPGVLEMRLRSVQTAETEPEELGQVRVVEILGGDPTWTRETLTYGSFSQGKPLPRVINPQPIVDLDVARTKGDTVRIPISEPVLRRLMAGKTRGLALRPLGPVSATFNGSAGEGVSASAVLHLDTSPDS